MKLIYCGECKDIVRLTMEERWCQCKSSGGRYLDGLIGEYWGEEVIPLGVQNSSFMAAIKSQPKEGWGQKFEAFVIPKDCDTFNHVKISKRTKDV